MFVMHCICCKGENAYSHYSPNGATVGKPRPELCVIVYAINPRSILTTIGVWKGVDICRTTGALMTPTQLPILFRCCE